MSNPAEGRNLHVRCLVGPLVAQTRGVLECSIGHASVVCIFNVTPTGQRPRLFNAQNHKSDVTHHILLVD